MFSVSLFGGGSGEEEEERVPKGDEVVVELDATLEDLYMGGSLKVAYFSRPTSINNALQICNNIAWSYYIFIRSMES